MAKVNSFKESFIFLTFIHINSSMCMYLAKQTNNGCTNILFVLIKTEQQDSNLL